MSITNQTTIQELIDLGVIKDVNILLWNIKAGWIQAKDEKAKLVTGTKSAIMEVRWVEPEGSPPAPPAPPCVTKQ